MGCLLSRSDDAVPDTVVKPIVTTTAPKAHQEILQKVNVKVKIDEVQKAEEETQSEARAELNSAPVSASSASPEKDMGTDSPESGLKVQPEPETPSNLVSSQEVEEKSEQRKETTDENSATDVAAVEVVVSDKSAPEDSKADKNANKQGFKQCSICKTWKAKSSAFSKNQRKKKDGKCSACV